MSASLGEAATRGQQLPGRLGVTLMSRNSSAPTSGRHFNPGLHCVCYLETMV